MYAIRSYTLFPYRLSLSAKQTQTGKSVSFRAPTQTDFYTIYDGENGGQYTYLLSGERVSLDIVTNDDTIPYYYPTASAVSSDDQGAYTTMTVFTVTNCRTGGTVTGTGNFVGGIVGGGYNGAPNSPGVMIYDSCSTAAVKGGDDVGGILGGDTASGPPSNGKPNITNSYWFGPSIEAESGSNVGGIVGYYATVNANCILTNNYFAVGGENTAADTELKGIGKIDNNALTGFDPDAAFRLMRMQERWKRKNPPRHRTSGF